MAMEYTEEQLNSFDKNTLVQLFLVCGNDEAEGTDCLVPVTSPEDI